MGDNLDDRYHVMAHLFQRRAMRKTLQLVVAERTCAYLTSTLNV